MNDINCVTTTPSKRMKKRKSWVEIREDVWNLRRRMWGVGVRLPHSFTFRKMLDKTRIYFMSSPPNSRENSLHAVDVPDDRTQLAGQIYPWIQILSPGFQGTAPPTKEEELMMERKRMTPTGISAYEFHDQTAKIVFTASPSIYECIDHDTMGPLTPIEVSSRYTTGARLNAEICPSNADLIAFVCNGDIWVLHSRTGQEERVTYTHKGCAKITDDPLSAGLPSYIVQEEFNRFHGFWWQPVTTDGVYRILFEEVDESNVNIVTLTTLPGKMPEDYRFPHPGTPNAVSTLKFVEFGLENDRIANVTIKNLHYPISMIFCWAEYIVRAGWTPDGIYVWAQLLSRSQKRLELVLFPLVPDPEEASKLKENLILPSAPVYVIFREGSDTWINVNDILSFLPSEEPNVVTFLWASEETGFRHIYKVKSELRPALSTSWYGQLNSGLCLSPLIRSKDALTFGEWEVINSGLALNDHLGFLFFIGLCDTPLERHLYVVSVHCPGEVRRLTQHGYSYAASFNSDCTLVTLTYSSTKDSPICRLLSINYSGYDINGIRLEPITFLVSRPLELFTELDNIETPEITSYYQTETGNVLYAMIHRPNGYVPGVKYPTILHVYGGPEVQLVYNSYKGNGNFWLYLLVSQGYCIVQIDSRGSQHRGTHFEGHLKNRMGTVEMKDQVEVLLWLAQKYNYIDLNRVGLFGWSYGGYLSLMGLAHYPNIFKISIAGAPVTSWELYDTGYTERYMDLPENNPQGYKEGSVLSYIQQFPDDENRLLIIHGLVDENVHFSHTSQFINAMIKAGKPYQLQLYPGERHSLRRIEASVHCEATILSFIQKTL